MHQGRCHAALITTAGNRPTDLPTSPAQQTCGNLGGIQTGELPCSIPSAAALVGLPLALWHWLLLQPSLNPSRSPKPPQQTWE